jgi:propionyl-CoA carboxylase beta chain
MFCSGFYRFGAASETHAEKICKVMDMAVKMGAPMIGLIRWRTYSRGCALFGGMLIFFMKVTSKWRDSANIGYYGPLRRWSGIFSAMTDFTMMVEDTSYMFVTGPNVVKGYQ